MSNNGVIDVGKSSSYLYVLSDGITSSDLSSVRVSLCLNFMFPQGRQVFDLSDVKFSSHLSFSSVRLSLPHICVLIEGKFSSFLCPQ